MREKSVFLSDLEKSKEFFTEIRITALSPRRISASDRPDIEARCGRQQPQHHGVRTGQRRTIAARSTGQGHGEGARQRKKTKARQSGTLLRKTYPPLSEGGGDQSGAMSSNEV